MWNSLLISALTHLRYNRTGFFSSFAGTDPQAFHGTIYIVGTRIYLLDETRFLMVLLISKLSYLCLSEFVNVLSSIISYLSLPMPVLKNVAYSY